MDMDWFEKSIKPSAKMIGQKIARPEEKRAIITNLTLNNESQCAKHE